VFWIDWNLTIRQGSDGDPQRLLLVPLVCHLRRGPHPSATTPGPQGQTEYA
jgi:hypothetical protein